MNSKLKKITDANFKANADLKTQYIFDDGYCYFIKSQAEQHTVETKKKFIEVKRDAKAEKQADANGEAMAELEARILEKKELILDASGEEKAMLEEEIATLEIELEELKK